MTKVAPENEFWLLGSLPVSRDPCLTVASTVPVLLISLKDSVLVVQYAFDIEISLDTVSN